MKTFFYTIVTQRPKPILFVYKNPAVIKKPIYIHGRSWKTLYRVRVIPSTITLKINSSKTKQPSPFLSRGKYVNTASAQELYIYFISGIYPGKTI